MGGGLQPSLNDRLMPNNGGRLDSAVEMESSPEPEVWQLQAIVPVQVRVCDYDCNR